MMCLRNSSFIQAEGAREVAHTGIEHGACEKVGAAGDELAPEVSAVRGRRREPCRALEGLACCGSACQ